MKWRPFTWSNGSTKAPVDELKGISSSPYITEYLAAFDRTELMGFQAPPRVLVKKSCVERTIVEPVLLDYFDRSGTDGMIGQTAAIHFALVPLLFDKTGVHFNLTTGWMVRQGKEVFRHDETLIEQFIEGKTQAWLSKGCPFHLWLTSPACEIVDITFAMNLGWARTRDECAKLIVYQSPKDSPGDLIYHPTLVGPDFFHKTGAVM